MRSPRTLVVAFALTAALIGAGCGGSSDASSGPTSGGGSPASSPGGTDVEAALESQTPDETVEVPSEDGATTIADYAAGNAPDDLAAPESLASILALIGTDADGYITSDAVVVQASAADATLWCTTTERLDIAPYTLIPVLADGTGVDCG